MNPIIVQACGTAFTFAPNAKDLAMAFLMLAGGWITDAQFLDIVKQIVGHVPGFATMAVKACVGVES